jgi:hypothetical protein
MQILNSLATDMTKNYLRGEIKAWITQTKVN